MAQFAKHIRPPGLGASNRATEREDIKTMLNWIKVTASSGDTVFIFVDHIRAIVETARGSTIITHQLDDGIPVLEYPEVLLAQIAEIAVERRAGPGW